MRLIEATAPSYWAPYLINRDGSDMEPDDCDAAEAFVDSCLEGNMPVSCEDAGFLWKPDAGEAGDCQTYQALAS